MKLNSIQALRAVAAMLVMIYHVRAIEMDAFLRNGLDDQPLVSLLIENGFAGVDLFFVISGFIMVYVTGEVRASLATSGAFLFARAARIYPVWWLFALIMTGYFFVAYGVPYDVERTVGGSELMAEQPWLHLVYSYLLLPQHSVPVFGLGWTLVHEMHFYLVFAVLMLMPRRFLPWLLGIWAAMVTGGSLAGLSGAYAADYLKLFFHPLSMEFIAGAFAAMLVTSGRRFRPGTVLALGLAAMFASLLLQGDETAFTLGWGRVLWFGIPCLLIVYGYSALEVEGRAGAPKWLVTVGDWSYALYLSHTFVLSALRRIFNALCARLEGTQYADWFTLGAPGLMDNVLFYLLGISLSMIAAWLTFRFFERPAMRLAGKMRRALFADTNAQLRPGPIRTAVW
ncbi:acyltransferase family protein [Henriciella pelagia]|uniref:Acyltransferase n=1 Tax=Henriciella pelagia TaxID=1977912 RepID=A0ABQ1JAG8_9PROT|nr:acyltransferase [Henriciella pelagia]GGB64062.1 acyltransferase [Henriciella pelagia]